MENRCAINEKMYILVVFYAALPTNLSVNTDVKSTQNYAI